MNQKRIKWDSYVLNIPDLLMVWRCHGILCAHFYFHFSFIYLFFFCLEQTLGKDT